MDLIVYLLISPFLLVSTVRSWLRFIRFMDPQTKATIIDAMPWRIIPMMQRGSIKTITGYEIKHGIKHQIIRYDKIGIDDRIYWYLTVDVRRLIV